MKRNHHRLFIHLIAPSLFLMMFHSHTLFAAPREGAGPDGAAAAHRSPASTSKVRVEGELSSTGDVLILRDSKTDKTYRLEGQNRSAWESFKAGNKKVAVEGTVNGDSLTVERTDTL